MPIEEKLTRQRKLVLETLKANSSPEIFEALADILGTEREFREHRRGVNDAIKKILERVADHPRPDQTGEQL